MGQAEVMLSAKEVDRLAAINRVLEGRSTQALAARPLGLSVRQAQRPCRAVRPSAVFDAICDIKPRLFGLGRVANPRDTARYRCGLRLAQTKNPSVLFVASSIKHYTRSAAAQALQRQAARMRHGNTFMRLPSPVFERNQKPC